MNQLVSVTARADTDGITLISRRETFLGYVNSTLGVLGGPIPQSADQLDEAAADALLAQLRYPRTGPWIWDGACWIADVGRRPVTPEPIRVQPTEAISHKEHLEATPEQVLTAIFRNPYTGTDLPVTITLFQYAPDPRLFGVGVYTEDEKGEFALGTVLRWDKGPDADPTVIHWEAPHCADDECGSPCGHEKI